MTATKKSAQSAKVAATKKAVKADKVTTTAEMTTAGAVAGQIIEEVKKKMTAKQQAAQDRREWLRTISANFQAERDLMQVMGAEYIPTINEMLHAYYEKNNEITELNTFDQWKEKGYQVRRGEKAFLFWGKPRNKQKKQAEPAEEQTEQEQQAQQTTAKKDDFYPICYLFDISQCCKA